MKLMHIHTPLLESLPMSNKIGRRIFLKMEALQPVGSFKIRGIGNLCMHLAQKGAKRFVITSAGNAGCAVAYAGRQLNIPVTVVVWNQVPSISRDILRREGAEVIANGDNLIAANEFARSLCDEKEVFYVHPFDNPMIWDGHATLINEIKADGLKPDAVVVAVGGGGLFSGVVLGLKAAGWSDVPVFTAETEGAASFAASMKAGKVVTLAKVDTIAVSIGAPRICDQAFLLAEQHPVIPLTVTDNEAVNAVLQFADDQRVLVEPACGAALALAYQKKAELMKYEKTLIVICGGRGVSLDLLNKWKDK